MPAVATLEALEASTYLSSVVRENLGDIEQEGREESLSPSFLVQRYVSLIVTHSANLSGVRELSATACCLFGIRPPTPQLEKEYIMEIMLRRQAQAPQTNLNPFGPVHTRWCIISKAWWDTWRFYVGRISGNSPRSPRSNTENSPELPISEPGPVDNWQVLKKTGVKQLMQGTVMGHHLEVIPPTVYAAMHAWYGGGPRIMRKVVPSANDSTELELFPLHLRVVTCDNDGKAKLDEKEFLFSKSATIEEMTSELCDAKEIDKSKARLWNYAQMQWREQYILSSEITLEQGGLQVSLSLSLRVYFSISRKSYVIWSGKLDSSSDLQSYFVILLA